MNPALLQKGSNSFRTDSEIKDHEGLLCSIKMCVIMKGLNKLLVMNEHSYIYKYLQV